MPINTTLAADLVFKKNLGIGFTTASLDYFQEVDPNFNTLISPNKMFATKVWADAGLIPPVVTLTPRSIITNGTPVDSNTNYLSQDGTVLVDANSPAATPVRMIKRQPLTEYGGDLANKTFYSSELVNAIPSTYTSGSDYIIALETYVGSTYTLLPTTAGYIIDTDAGTVVFTTTPNTSATIYATFYKYVGPQLSSILNSKSATLTGSFSGSFQGLFYNPDGSPFSGGGGGTSGVQTVISSSLGAYVSASGTNVEVSASSFLVTASAIVLSGSITAAGVTTFSNTANQFTGSFSGSFSGISTDTISSGNYKIQVLSTGQIQATGSLVLSGSSQQITGSLGVEGQTTVQSLYTNAISSSGTVFVSGTLSPDGTIKNNLGGPSNKWNTVYANSGSFSRVDGDLVVATSASFGRVTATSIQTTTQETLYVSSSFIIISSGSTTTQATNGLLIQTGSNGAVGLLFAQPQSSLQAVYGSSNRWGYSTSIDLTSPNTSRNANILPFMRIETSFDANTPPVLGKGDFMMVSQSNGSIDLYIYA